MCNNMRIRRFLCLLFVFVGSSLTQTIQHCPKPADISPCSCSVKKNGLDIICEFTDHVHINNAITALKQQQNAIIFYLKLRHNSFPKLQGFVFLGLVVQHLTIHNSSLATVEESSLSSIGKGLTQLDLSQNYLTYVPSSALVNLHSLIILNLNRNKIKELHARSFAGLDTLEILSLYENKISSIDPDAFTGLDDRKLKRLNLGGNQLTSVPTSALSSLDVLKKLELQENKITSIQEGDFEGLKSLDSLVLSHNQIREVPARVFSHLTQLNSLELEGNLINYVDPDAFIGLEENLQYLKLNENNLHIIPSDALRRLHRLRHLELKSNNITVLSDDAFTSYGDSISFLNLQKNLIKTLPVMIFENLNSLQALNLGNNKLTHIPEETIEDVLDTLVMIDITDNPLICTCDLRWFPYWLKNLKGQDDDTMSKKRTVCTMLPENREYALQNIPLEKMGCVGKTGRISGSGIASYYNVNVLQFIIVVSTAALL
ncbi:leucine-rich repeat-containing protein 70-like [Chelonus insularis]|uniref:leucine-rich repeat-containing protein 70-like n=1 Tax=Chelonus insularis TaxID=460826 RepID=UPI00158B5E24|nr:leucine-rich repeat-containing protein 70-like [Chelonus insularis]XP_034939282.1 leucine-rich repeat-containing protein 70-like [Chelonus insularis]XP_034939283.1 leucine-rich repeat-containing protein 70-like [Chelonus insularis]XP_034939284.1 leucine-rich repeat-containing protein 70-like [Chelonus insularis]XP_034939285.1 leucine-rich repeat-containing protein 70-like [Chelonus insularis]XP_034939286.1 leucine-rich repeat-containing protein 70-like [Chelonus insularis]XP_034939287.1 le